MDVHISLIGRRNLSGEIYRQLRQAILDGRLRAGERLPPTRELAERLSVSRTTVTVAYDRLSASGFVTTRVGAGTFVRDGVTVGAGNGQPARRLQGTAVQPREVWKSIPLVKPFERPARFDFRSGIPDATLFPYQRWRRLVSGELKRRDRLVGIYADPAGDADLREAVARHIGVSRGIDASADDIIITSGTQQALDLLAKVLVEPGETVALEDPCYTPARWLFRSHGIRTAGVPVDGDGLVVDALPGGVRLLYATPSHQYPLGVTLSLDRRIALLDWATRHDAAIIEDDYDSEFRYGGRPVEPLKTLDRDGRVIYVGSFSKALLPALRMGFLLVPPSLRDAVQRAKFMSDWHSPLFAQRALARFIDDGDFARHVRRMNRIYQARHEKILEVLASEFGDLLDVIPSSTGLHISAFARRASADDIQTIRLRAANVDVAVQELARFAHEPPGRPGLLLGYGAIATSRIADGLRRLRACFDESSP
jgi:GntR family transcriptional regulator/MocR family aminotransferase